jgi:hypothetical protein
MCSFQTELPQMLQATQHYHLISKLPQILQLPPNTTTLLVSCRKFCKPPNVIICLISSPVNMAAEEPPPMPCESITGEHVSCTTDAIRNGTLSADLLQFFMDDVNEDDVLPCLNRLVAGMCATPPTHVDRCFYRSMFIYVAARVATNRAILADFSDASSASPHGTSTQTTTVVREYVKAIDRLNDTLIALHPGESATSVFDRGLYPEMAEAAEVMSEGGGAA